ncbi:GNAT family N-acetyltransferase [Chromobacterium sp. IIBBL 290-4]|uniref:GNAT family N-acetyltransferase n=1 Tax=Chromobacterium sp. IIBBL 290-4 TaxID=2953890 RepID=UPI0020B8EA6D|nr:GNAT family N-acetyltransferase [Chromobacterium sp. IIBBL 290-4]UTH73636.1 GNAT family N-acetyltransferase [Chromobacterium sp. IIBBL 290-4]
MNIGALDGLQAIDLHACFLAAFSDYVVPAQPTLAQFEAMLKRRGWAPELSAGAWVDGELAGLWLTATPMQDGQPEGYCIAAGVAPLARRRGVLSDMAARVQSLLRARGIRQLRLEVIESNQRARDAYAKLGFQAVRKLDCYQIETPIQSASFWPVTVHVDADPAGWPSPDAIAYPPAVPNRRESLLRAAPPPRWLTVRQDGQLLGSLLMTADGEALELQVAPTRRRRGIASKLLQTGQGLAQNGRLSFNNVDPRDLALLELLRKHRGRYALSQWELLQTF